MKYLRTTEQVIDALGGPEKLCEVTEANPKQAWHWYGRADQFPCNTYVAITRALRRRGYRAPDHLWPMKGIKRAA